MSIKCLPSRTNFEFNITVKIKIKYIYYIHCRMYMYAWNNNKITTLNYFKGILGGIHNSELNMICWLFGLGLWCLTPLLTNISCWSALLEEETGENHQPVARVKVMVYNITFFQYFSYIVEVSLIERGSRSTLRKQLTCRKSLTNFI